MQITDMNIDEIIGDLCRSHTDLENHVAPSPQFDNQVLHIEANFWQKVATNWGILPWSSKVFSMLFQWPI